jgi:hypothetical protein
MVNTPSPAPVNEKEEIRVGDLVQYVNETLPKLYTELFENECNVQPGKTYRVHKIATHGWTSLPGVTKPFNWIVVSSLRDGSLSAWLPMRDFIKFSYVQYDLAKKITEAWNDYGSAGLPGKLKVWSNQVDTVDTVGDSNDLDYEFKASSPDALDEYEIEKELSKENPVCIVHNSAKRLHKILTHHSIHMKTEYVAEEIYMEYLNTNPYTWDSWYETGTNEFGYNRITDVMNVIRKIKNAPYENKEETLFKVVFPKIF